MRTKNRLIILEGLALLGALGCAALRPAQIVEQFNVGATATEVRMAVEQYHDAMRRRDVPTIVDTFIRDTSFRAYDGDEGWLTIDNIRLQDAPAFSRLKSFTISVDSLAITVLDPSAAVVSSNLHETLTDSAGHEERLRLTQSTVWTRRATGWKIAHVHSSERPDSTR
ncbi:MAG: nuclear transport factor 2 family protein [Gemmatimonadaceae bacterium]